MAFSSQIWNVCFFVTVKNTSDSFGDLLEWVPANVGKNHYHIENADKVIPFDGKSYTELQLHLENEEDINLIKLIFGHRYNFVEVYRRRPC